MSFILYKVISTCCMSFIIWLLNLFLSINLKFCFNDDCDNDYDGDDNNCTIVTVIDLIKRDRGNYIVIIIHCYYPVIFILILHITVYRSSNRHFLFNHFDSSN